MAINTKRHLDRFGSFYFEDLLSEDHCSCVTLVLNMLAFN